MVFRVFLFLGDLLKLNQIKKMPRIFVLMCGTDSFFQKKHTFKKNGGVGRGIQVTLNFLRDKRHL